MNKCVIHSDLYALFMDGMDVVSRYPWMDLVDTVIVTVQKKFLKLWYKNKKITLQDISVSEKVETKEAQAERSTVTDTSNDESLVEAIMEDKVGQKDK